MCGRDFAQIWRSKVMKWSDEQVSKLHELCLVEVSNAEILENLMN